MQKMSQLQEASSSLDKGKTNFIDPKKRAVYLLEFRRLATGLPSPYREKCSSQFLEQLADAVADGMVFEILTELREIQRMNEKEHWESRCAKVAEQEMARREISGKNRPLLTSTTFVPGLNHPTALCALDKDPELMRFDEQCREELRRNDMRIVLDIDRLVSQQQVTIERAGVPGFYVTNKPDEVRFQMYILDFLEKVKPK